MEHWLINNDMAGCMYPIRKRMHGPMDLNVILQEGYMLLQELGIQVMDQLGRVNAILPAPPANGQTSNVCFGGPDFNILYVSCW